jgi:predicted ATPase
VTTKASPDKATETHKHPFAELLAQYRQRKPGLTQTQLAELAGYDQAILVRMAQGKKDLTGPSGRERVVRLIETLADQGALTTLDEANALLLTADLPPLFERQSTEARLIERLSRMQIGHRVRRTNLPAPLTSFVGRAQEINDVRRLLNTTRLLTLTGAGGCGKTRLAQRVAADVLIAYSEGVWYAELASLTDPALIADSVARALGLIVIEQSSQERVLDYLRERHVLLVLDNCEHLIEAVATFAIVVLQACPCVTILTTSREALNVEGETAWRVPPMQPDEAGRLFMERGAAARGDVTLSANDETVANICRRLDGMPLAIELAAARLSAMSLNEIAARLDDRFGLLAGGRRGALPRHQTLRAMIDWSYDALTEPEKVAFRRLGVFVGGWVIEEAEQVVCDDKISRSTVLPLMTQLVSKSLVMIDSHESKTRYRYLETFRQYALEKLSEMSELANTFGKHTESFVELAERAEPHIRDNEQKYWVARLKDDHDNIRAALSRSLSSMGEAQAGLRLASHMWQFWWIGHIVEGAAWLKKLLDATGLESPAFTRGRAWLGYGSLLLAIARAEDINVALEEAMRLFSEVDDRQGIAFALYILGCCREFQNDDRVMKLLSEGWSFERWQGNQLGMVWAVYMCARHNYWIHNDPGLAQRMKVAEDAIKFASQQGDLQIFALASFDASVVELYRMNLDNARKTAQQAVEAARVVGACWEETALLSHLGEVLQLMGDVQAAHAALSQSLECVERFGWPDRFKSRSYYVLGRLARDGGDYALSKDNFLKSVEYAGKEWPSVCGIEGLSCTAAAQGDHVFAAQLLGMSEALRSERDDLWWEKDERDFEPYHAKSRAALGDEAYEAAYAEGRAMSLERAIELALASTDE